jgi:hypothetical protein
LKSGADIHPDDKNFQKTVGLCKHCRTPKEWKICKYKKPQIWIAKWCRHSPGWGKTCKKD